jgi:HK97 family phage portal protein
MNLLAPFKRLNTALEQRIMSVGEWDRLLDAGVYGYPTLSGQTVTVDTALTTSAVWACVQAYAKTISALTCELYKKNPSGGKTQLLDHRVARILDSPNDEQTPLEFWETMVTHRFVYGNAYAQIEQDGYGPKELWVLNPTLMTVKRNKDSGDLEYLYGRDPNHPKEIFDFREVFHLRGPSVDALRGMSIINLARQTIGLALATEAYGASWFGNGSNPGGFLSTEGTITEESAKRLARDWQEAHQGTANAHKVAVLENGLKWTQVSTNPEESQFSQTTIATVETIARFFHVPPHKIGLLGNVNKASIEEQELEWYTEGIRPECTRITQTIQRDLINISDGKRGIYAEHDFTELLRGNLAAETTFMISMRQWGAMCVDEMRARIGLNPLPDGLGQIFLNPMNMVPAGQEVEPVATAPIQGLPGPEDDPPSDINDPTDPQAGTPGMTQTNGTNGHGKSLRDLLTVATGRYS